MDELVAEQNHQLELADRFDDRGTRAVYALPLLALVAVVFCLSALIGTGVGTTLVLGGVALAAAGGWGGSALLV